MTITRADTRAIQQAIRQLPRREREELAEWILNSQDTARQVAETAPAYGDRGHMTVEEYLNLEAEGLVRYEYIAGQIFAMSSPLNRHEMIVTNLVFQFQNQLRGGPCRAWSSNTKVRLQVDRDDIFYMPDVTVVCGAIPEEVLNQQYLTNPCVVVEVLSASTEAIDRREKALNYRHIPSLEEYLVVAQRSMEVTVFRSRENWSPQVLTRPEDVFESHAVEVNIELAKIYERTR